MASRACHLPARSWTRAPRRTSWARGRRGPAPSPPARVVALRPGSSQQGLATRRSAASQWDIRSAHKGKTLSILSCMREIEKYIQAVQKTFFRKVIITDVFLATIYSTTRNYCQAIHFFSVVNRRSLSTTVATGETSTIFDTGSALSCWSYVTVCPGTHCPITTHSSVHLSYF